jgi:hypothetical protein
MQKGDFSRRRKVVQTDSGLNIERKNVRKEYMKVKKYFSYF